MTSAEKKKPKENFVEFKISRLTKLFALSPGVHPGSIDR